MRTAVEGEWSKVAGAPSGSRNNELNTAAFNLGMLVAAGVLSANDVETTLLDASLQNGLVSDDGERSVQATISSGLQAGMHHPRELPDFNDNTDAKPKSHAKTTPSRPPIRATPFILRDPRLIPTREWLYGRHYIRKFVSTTVAPGGLGKSSLIIAEAVAMVTGRNLLGASPAGRLNVWLWNGEDPQDELERRLAATALQYEVSNDDIAGHLFVDNGRDMEIVIAEETREGTMISVPVVNDVIETIRANKLDVFQVDPFVSSHRVTENDNNAIDRVAKTWARIADQTGTAIELVHHVRKTAPGHEITVEDGRGASALLAAARSARVLNPMVENEANSFGLESKKGFFRIGVGKSNLAPPPDKDDWFRMASVDLGNGPMGLVDTGDKVGVVTVWTPPDPLASMSIDDLNKAQSACGNRQWRANEQASEWVGKPIAAGLGLDIGNGKKKDMTKQQLQNKERVKAMLRVWLGSGAFVEVEGFDEHRERRTFIEVGDATK